MCGFTCVLVLYTGGPVDSFFHVARSEETHVLNTAAKRRPNEGRP